MKLENDKNSMLNEECQRIIDELKKDTKIYKEERDQLMKTNLQITEERDKA